MQIINIPLEIPEGLIQAGAIELYASKMAGWTPKLRQSSVSETGNLITIEIDNPETAFDACVREIRAYVKNNYQTIVAEQAREQAASKALEDFNQLFTPDHE
jgi:hypothetical protein